MHVVAASLAMKSSYDVVILGAGHNGLVAAAYLARAGLSVLLLEKNDYIGGATTSQQVFPDYDARLSRYSYLVSLFPEKIIRDLGLKIELRRRTTGSFTPYFRNGRHEGLLLSNVDEEASRCSLLRLTGGDLEYQELKRFYGLARVFAEQAWDTMLEPLESREKFHQRFQSDSSEQEAWRSLVEEPLGCAIERYLQDDLLRGVVFTDGKIGVSTHPHDPSLLQNRCFLYHLIGNRTGEWRVPVGGMGHVAGELERAARAAGAEMHTRVELARHRGGRENADGELRARRQAPHGGRALPAREFRPQRAFALSQSCLAAGCDRRGIGLQDQHAADPAAEVEDGRSPVRDAFCGTFHCDEGYEEMKRSYEQAVRGELPERPPCEVYCHTLTDDSILGPELREQGFQTMTLFGIDTPWSLFARDNEAMRAQAERAFLDGMNRWLAEPLEDCLAVSRDGWPCIESKSPVDIEEALGLYHGNIFQSALTFPFATSKADVGTWGVETEFENVFLCGSSAQRGGAVSGIPGHNAARKVLERSSCRRTKYGARRGTLRVAPSTWSTPIPTPSDWQPLAFDLRSTRISRLQLGQALFEFAAEHLVHVHEEADRLGHEIAIARHGPGDLGLIAVGLEGELGRGGILERLEEIQFDPDQLVGLALENGHAALADLRVARPFVDRAGARRRALVGDLHGGIELRPGRPGIPAMEIVDLVEHRRRGRGDLDRSHDAIAGGLERDDHSENHDQGDEGEEYFLKHGRRRGRFGRTG